MKKLYLWIVLLIAIILLLYLGLSSLFNFSLVSFSQETNIDLSPVFSNNPFLFSNPQAEYFFKGSLIWNHDESSGRFNFSLVEGSIVYGVYPQLIFPQEYDTLSLQIEQDTYSPNYSLSISPYLIAESFEDIPNSTVAHINQGNFEFYVPVNPNVSVSLSILNKESGENFILAQSYYFNKVNCIGYNESFVGDKSNCCSGLSPIFFGNGTGVCSLCRYTDGTPKEFQSDIPENECMFCDGNGSFLLKPTGSSCLEGIGFCKSGKCVMNTSIII